MHANAQAMHVDERNQLPEILDAWHTIMQVR